MLTGAVLATLAIVACEGPPRRTGDVNEIREAGELRVAVRPGFLNAPVNGEGGDGEAVLLGQLASRLGVAIRWM